MYLHFVFIFVKMVLDNWNKQVSAANKLLGSLTDADLEKEVALGRNRGVYLLGHLTAVNDKMLPLLNFGEAKYPKLYEDFAMKPDRAVAEIPSASELRTCWINSCDELSSTLAKQQLKTGLEGTHLLLQKILPKNHTAIN